MSVFTDTAVLLRDYADFPDTCVATRVTGETLNTTTGVMEETTVEAYSGSCLYRKRSRGETEFGEILHQEIDGDLYLPHDAAMLENGDRVVVTGTLDDEIPELTVLRLVADSYMVRRHYECEAHP